MISRNSTAILAIYWSFNIPAPTFLCQMIISNIGTVSKLLCGTRFFVLIAVRVSCQMAVKWLSNQITVQYNDMNVLL